MVYSNPFFTLNDQLFFFSHCSCEFYCAIRLVEKMVQWLETNDFRKLFLEKDWPHEKTKQHLHPPKVTPFESIFV